MRRSVIVLAAAALLGGSFAFAPATPTQQAETDHAIVFTEDGTETVEGAETNVGVNPGWPAPEGCTKDPNTYCETVHVTVQQPVVDEDPENIEFGTGQVTFTLAPAAPGPDFDINVFESDESGTSRGDLVGESGNFPACSVLCETPLSEVIGAGCGPDHDECGSWAVSTSDLAGTRYYVIEVIYYLAAGPYTLDVTYERTDGRNFDGTTRDTDEPVPTPLEPAESVARIDVTGGYEATGDWNGGQGGEVGDALGQDIEAAFMEYAEETFTFTIDVTNLPAAGGTPELTRYTWDFAYNGTPFELDGKFTNYSRGACDPTAGSCPPPRNPGVGFFALRGNCVTDGSVTTCEELGSTTATFDPATGEIAIPVPASLLTEDGVAGCDTIVGSNVVAQVSAFFSLSTGPQDAALPYLPFTVPPADESVTCA